MNGTCNKIWSDFWFIQLMHYQLTMLSGVHGVISYQKPVWVSPTEQLCNPAFKLYRPFRRRLWKSIHNDKSNTDILKILRKEKYIGSGKDLWKTLAYLNCDNQTK